MRFINHQPENGHGTTQRSEAFPQGALIRHHNGFRRNESSGGIRRKYELCLK